MQVRLIFRNEPAGMTEDGAEGADSQTGVSRNSQDLNPVRSCAFQFHMAPPLGHNEKAKQLEDSDDLVPGQFTKLGYRWNPLRG